MHKNKYIGVFLSPPPKMKLEAECIPCLLRRIVYEAEMVEPEKAFDAVMLGCRILANATKSGVSVEIATKVHHAVYKLLGTEDPYKDVKQRSNQVALSLLPEIKRTIEHSDDPLRTAFLAAIAGNVMDFGIRGGIAKPELLREKVFEMMEQGLAVDDIDEAIDRARGKEVLYFADNCGEIVFDSIVIDMLRDMGIRVVLVVKGGPILSDATMEDVKNLGIKADEYMTTNSRAVGVDFKKIGEGLRNKLENCNLIIAKGMANFESFSETDY
ncbi:MAG: hypothetical protein DRN20_04700, partial [Thermoplasmata archaeon]